VFAGLFLLFIGALMVGGTLYGIRHGKVMTLRKSAFLHREKWALRGQPGFWPYAVCWLAFGGYVLYQGVRLIHLA
jgi:hypothetical protein